MVFPASPRSHYRCHSHRELCEQVTAAHRIHRRKSEIFTKKLLDKLKNYRKKDKFTLTSSLRSEGDSSKFIFSEEVVDAAFDVEGYRMDIKFCHYCKRKK
jgi:hypothetical protein